MPEITTISTKGQVVIPSHIRQELGLEEGSQLVVSRMEDLVLVKKVNVVDRKKEIELLKDFGIKNKKKMGIKSEEDVVRIMHESRKRKA